MATHFWDTSLAAFLPGGRLACFLGFNGLGQAEEKGLKHFPAGGFAKPTGAGGGKSQSGKRFLTVAQKSLAKRE